MNPCEPISNEADDFPILALAPMQDVTDHAFLRALHRIHCVPDLFVTPYLRSTPSSCVMRDSVLRCIEENPLECPVWVQLAGSEVAPLLRDIAQLRELPIAGINLNAGCPSPLVNRHGAGAALLKNPAHLKSICCALRDALPRHCRSVKCRLGWDDAEEFPRILEALSAGEPGLLIVHARTRRQLYSGTPNMGAVRMAVQQMPCPVLANGDITSLATAEQWLTQTRARGLMLGRGIVRNPFLFRELRGGSKATPEEMKSYYITLLEETGRDLSHRSPRAHCNRMKKYLAYCYADFSQQQEYTLRRCISPSEMEKILTNHLRFTIDD